MLALVAGLFAFAVSAALTPLVREAAWRLGAVANPRADRWHARPTALGGGIAVGLALAVVLAFDSEWHGSVGFLLAGAMIMLVMGLADDLWHLRPWLKFSIQLLAALLLPLAGVRLDWTGVAVLDVLLTVAWIVGITNAVNLVDNMDGLAAGLVGIAGASLCLVFVLHLQPAQARAAAAIAGAAAGFLVFNFKPASIFLGDVGTMFLGYTIAGLATYVGRGRPFHFAASSDILVLLLLVPIYDTAYVMIRRSLEGRSFWTGGRDHTSHGLVALGCSERRAVLTLYGLCALGSADAVLLAAGHRAAGLLLMIPIAVVLVWFTLRLARTPGARRDSASVSGAVTDPPVHGAAPSRPRHAFTVDVEEWFEGIPLDSALRAAAEPRLERGLEPLLALLETAGVRGTFFVLGPLALSNPAIIHRIAAAGHEVGCHGWSHELVYTMTPERFRDETRRARDAISGCTGAPVLAYRAAYFSITQQSLWALDVLAELGFRYDSSIFPVDNWRYGIPGFDPRPRNIETAHGAIAEWPISTRRVCGRNIPVSGGAYFRLYPFAVTRGNLLAAETAQRPAVFYIHPWELDPDHPRAAFDWKARLTHYANLRSTEPRLRRLLEEFRFGRLGELLELELLARAPSVRASGAVTAATIGENR